MYSCENKYMTRNEIIKILNKRFDYNFKMYYDLFDYETETLRTDLVYISVILFEDMQAIEGFFSIETKKLLPNAKYELHHILVKNLSRHKKLKYRKMRLYDLGEFSKVPKDDSFFEGSNNHYVGLVIRV